MSQIKIGDARERGDVVEQVGEIDRSKRRRRSIRRKRWKRKVRRRRRRRTTQH